MKIRPALIVTAGASALVVGLTATIAAAQAADDPPVTGYVAITYDDGPTPGVLQIIDTLKAKNSYATFFFTGTNTQGNPAIAKAAADAGYEVGDHSWDHPDLTTLTDAQVTDQLQRTIDAITAAGVPRPQLWRPPFGATNEKVRGLASALGMSQVNFDNVPADYEGGAKADPAYICDFAVSHAKDQSIVLLHDFVAGSVTALPCIIDGLRAKGLEPGRLIPSTTRSSLSDSYVEVVAPPGGATPTPTPSDPTVRTDPTDDRDTGRGSGTQAALSVSSAQTGYLRFDISGAPTVSKAELRIKRRDVTQGKLTVRVREVADDAWSDQAPAARLPKVGKLAGTAPSDAADWVTIDVTPYVKTQKVTDDVVTFALQTNRSGVTAFTSKDAAGDWPQLVVVP